jgi:hypothetical protein
VALKNLIALLKDPGPDFAPAPLDYTLTSASADLHHTLLQKRDGSFWLALWQNVLSYDPNARQDLTVAAVNVALNFNGVPLVRATTYLPNTSTSPTGSVSATDALNLAVDDRVTLVQLRLAAPGDANADGLVDEADVATFFHHYGQSVTPGAGWAMGDFNRDGAVGFIDYQLLELNYGRAFTPALQAEAAALMAATPEPAGVIPPVIGLAILLRRNRRVSRNCR